MQPLASHDVLLEAEAVRIDDAGRPAIERLTVKTTGSNIAVLGAARALFEAAAGMREVAHGTLRIAGHAPRAAIRDALVASAPMDAALPLRWKVRDLVIESARLAGRGREAKDAANAAIDAMQLRAFASTRLVSVETSIRRATILAAALATGAQTLLVEDFTPGLTDAAARSLARVFTAATAERQWILFAGRLALSSPLGLHADEALLFAGGRFVSSGAPGELAARDRTFAIRTSGDDASAFAAELRERGAIVEGGASGGALTVTIPAGFATHELVALAKSGGAVVLELLPISGALS